MYPEWLVTLERDGAVVRHEFFFRRRNAERAFEQAQKLDRFGHRNLVGEVDGEWATHDVTPKLKQLRASRTKSDRFRKSFLNLRPSEADELAKINDVPVKIIWELSEIEKWIAEGKRAFGKSWSERTEAMLRKNLPAWLSRFIILRM